MHAQVSRSCWAAEPAAIMRVLLLLAASAQLCLCFRPMSTVRRVAPGMSLEQLQKQRPTSKAAATAVAGIVTAAASFAPLNLPAVAAAGPDPLPSNIRELLTEVKQANEPLVLRDAIKKLAEVDSLDELYFDSGARSEVNSELKELQRENPDMWAPESLYYAGIVRRAVNPYHVVELEGWLKAAPFVGGLGYLIAIFVQRKLPQFFAIAYFAAVASVVIPAGLIALQ